MERLILLGILLLLIISPAVQADDQDRALALKQSGQVLPLEQILTQARHYQTGRLLEVELEQEDGRLIYELEMLDDHGRVWELKFDAANGKLLKQEED